MKQAFFRFRKIANVKRSRYLSIDGIFLLLHCFVHIQKVGSAEYISVIRMRMFLAWCNYRVCGHCPVNQSKTHIPIDENSIGIWRTQAIFKWKTRLDEHEYENICVCVCEHECMCLRKHLHCFINWKTALVKHRGTLFKTVSRQSARARSRNRPDEKMWTMWTKNHSISQRKRNNFCTKRNSIITYKTTQKLQRWRCCRWCHWSTCAEKKVSRFKRTFTLAVFCTLFTSFPSFSSKFAGKCACIATCVYAVQWILMPRVVCFAFVLFCCITFFLFYLKTFVSLTKTQIHIYLPASFETIDQNVNVERYTHFTHSIKLNDVIF